MFNDPILSALLAQSIDGGGGSGGGGVSVESVTINSAGNLIVTLTDGTTLDAGHCVGAKGAKGDTGETGEKGDTGAAGENGRDGADGADGVSPTIKVQTNTASIYQLAIHNADGTTILTPNLLGSGASTTRYYAFDNAMYTNYLDTIYTWYSTNLKSLRDYVEEEDAFCNAESNHALYYNTTTFGWSGAAHSFCTVPMSINSTQILLYGYISNASKANEYFKFVPAGLVTGTTDLEKAQAIEILLQANAPSIINIDFEYVYAQNGVTEAVSLADVPDGEYYIVWSGTSDNSRPKINDITIM